MEQLYLYILFMVVSSHPAPPSSPHPSFRILTCVTWMDITKDLRQHWIQYKLILLRKYYYYILYMFYRGTVS